MFSIACDDGSNDDDANLVYKTAGILRNVASSYPVVGNTMVVVKSLSFLSGIYKQLDVSGDNPFSDYLCNLKGSLSKNTVFEADEDGLKGLGDEITVKGCCENVTRFIEEIQDVCDFPTVATVTAYEEYMVTETDHKLSAIFKEFDEAMTIGYSPSTSHQEEPLSPRCVSFEEYEILRKRCDLHASLIRKLRLLYEKPARSYFAGISPNEPAANDNNESVNNLKEKLHEMQTYKELYNNVKENQDENNLRYQLNIAQLENQNGRLKESVAKTLKNVKIAFSSLTDISFYGKKIRNTIDGACDEYERLITVFMDTLTSFDVPSNLSSTLNTVFHEASGKLDQLRKVMDGMESVLSSIPSENHETLECEKSIGEDIGEKLKSLRVTLAELNSKCEMQADELVLEKSKCKSSRTIVSQMTGETVLLKKTLFKLQQDLTKERHNVETINSLSWKQTEMLRNKTHSLTKDLLDVSQMLLVLQNEHSTSEERQKKEIDSLANSQRMHIEAIQRQCIQDIGGVLEGKDLEIKQLSDSHKEEMERLEDILKEKKTELNALRQLLYCNECTTSKLSEELLVVKSKITLHERVKNEKATLSAALAERQEELVNLRKTLEEQREKLKEQRHQICVLTESESNNSEILCEIRHQLESHQSITERCSYLENELLNLKNVEEELKRSNERNDNLLELLEKMEDMKIAEGNFQKTILSLEKKVNEYDSEHAILKIHLDASNAKLLKMSDIEIQHQSLITKSHELSVFNHKLENQSKIINEQLSNYKARCDEQNEEIQNYKLQKEGLLKELKSTKSLLHTTEEDLSRQLEEYNKRYLDFTFDMNGYVEEAEKSKHLSEQNSFLEKQLTQHQEKNRKLAQHNTQQLKENTDLSTTLKKQELLQHEQCNKIDEFTSQITQLTTNLERRTFAERNTSDEMQKLRKKAETQNDKLESLLTKYHELEDVLKQKSKIIETTEKIVKELQQDKQNLEITIQEINQQRYDLEKSNEDLDSTVVALNDNAMMLIKQNSDFLKLLSHHKIQSSTGSDNHSFSVSNDRRQLPSSLMMTPVPTTGVEDVTFLRAKFIELEEEMSRIKQDAKEQSNVKISGGGMTTTPIIIPPLQLAALGGSNASHILQPHSLSSRTHASAISHCLNVCPECQQGGPTSHCYMCGNPYSPTYRSLTRKRNHDWSDLELSVDEETLLEREKRKANGCNQSASDVATSTEDLQSLEGLHKKKQRS